MVQRGMTWSPSLVLMALILMGPALALACSYDPKAPWTKRSPDGRFELIMRSRWSEPRDGLARLSVRDRRSGAVLWTTSFPEDLDSQDVLMSQDGSTLLVIQRFGAKLGLYSTGGGQLVGSWSFETLLTRSEAQRISTSECRIKQ